MPTDRPPGAKDLGDELGVLGDHEDQRRAHRRAGAANAWPLRAARNVVAVSRTTPSVGALRSVFGRVLRGARVLVGAHVGPRAEPAEAAVAVRAAAVELEAAGVDRRRALAQAEVVEPGVDELRRGRLVGAEVLRAEAGAEVRVVDTVSRPAGQPVKVAQLSVIVTLAGSAMRSAASPWAIEFLTLIVAPVADRTPAAPSPVAQAVTLSSWWVPPPANTAVPPARAIATRVGQRRRAAERRHRAGRPRR